MERDPAPQQQHDPERLQTLGPPPKRHRSSDADCRATAPPADHGHFSPTSEPPGEPVAASESAPSQDGGAAEAEPAGLLGLPDAVLASILELLGLREAWRARAACRRLRAVAETVEWSAIELRTRRPESVSALAALARGGARLRRDAAGGPLRVSLDLRREALEEGGIRPSASQEHELSVVSEALLFACALAARPRDVRVQRAPLPPRDLERLVTGSLAALAGGTAAPCLASLRLESSCRPTGGATACALDAPHAEFGSRLAPFSALGTLALPRGALVGPLAAAAIASACPRLSSLSLCLLGAASLAALAELPSLSSLEVLPGAGDAVLSEILYPGLDRFTVGPAGRSLRALRVASDGRGGVEAPGDVLRALARARSLQDIDLDILLRIPVDSGASSPLASLAALPALRRLALRLRLRDRDGAHLAGLAALARAAPALSALDLALEAAPDLSWDGVDDEALSALLEAARLSLRHFETQYFPALMPHEADALAQIGPQLESACIGHHILDEDDPEPYGALRPLAERLPRGALRVEPVLQRQLPGRPGEASRVSSHARRRLPRLLPTAKVSFTYA
eukprot:tig00001000_g6174.t1